jgi:AcrR family transcriptional regulator
VVKNTGTGSEAKRARVPQAERRRITRGKLLDATIDSLIEIGYSRTTTVEVGERAGLSRGAQLHHFPSKADLLVAAIEHLADERSKEFEVELAQRLEQGDDPVDTMVDMLWSMFSDPIYWATIELMVAARTDPELLEKLETFERSLGSRIYGAFKELTGQQGREAKGSLEMTLYFMRGLAMERIFRENEAHYTNLLKRWKEQLRALLGA